MNDDDRGYRRFLSLIGYLIALAALSFYVIWLVSKMTRSPAADDLALELAIGLASGLLALGVGVAWGRRTRR